MNKQNNQRRQTILPTVITTIILLCGNFSTFAQGSLETNNLQLAFLKQNISFKYPGSNFVPESLNSLTDYPNPDLTAISDYYEVINSKYDYPRPWLLLTLKVRKDIDQYDNFSVHFLDEDGAEVGYQHGQPALGGHHYKGEVLHEKIGAPTERDMAKVKKVIFQREMN